MSNKNKLFTFFCFTITLLCVQLSLCDETNGTLGINQEDIENARHGKYQFPKGFKFGCASAAYQVEGAWNEDGKGESMWDHGTHAHPELIKGLANADVACDSYHKYKEDVQLIKNMGFDVYRFSISWSRILPNGEENNINEAGVRYYRNLIDELIAHGITPMVTLYHWDLPQRLQEIGGWANPLMADYFERYCRVVFSKFGHKVKTWITLNEPLPVANAYGSTLKIPALDHHGTGEYLAAHTLLRAHAKAYHLYKREFHKSQHGKVGITISAKYGYPLKNTANDRKAVETYLQFHFGWYAHPIFSKAGDYPPLMRKIVDENSRKEGRTTSRLPTFTKKEIEEIRGSADFFGLNHYTSKLITFGKAGEKPSWVSDAGVVLSSDPKWPKSASVGLQSVPAGFRGILKWVKKNYNNPPVIITENGFCDDGTSLEDHSRIKYFKDYLTELLRAIHEDKCNVKGYVTWSLMDNFEWMNGYTLRYGLYHVDFEDPKRTRYAKKSVQFIKALLKKKRVPTEF